MDSPVRGFSHIQLRVTDVARSVEWWCAALGLAAMGEPRGGAAPLVGGGGRYVVVISEGYAGAGDVDHVAFSVGDRAALAAWGDHLTAAGVAHGGLVASGEGLSIHLVDPDGTNVELIAP
jgi:catechol 2,3-dioxygenase-like lactoylglutathione lyase family enzyme